MNSSSKLSSTALALPWHSPTGTKREGICSLLYSGLSEESPPCWRGMLPWAWLATMEHCPWGQNGSLQICREKGTGKLPSHRDNAGVKTNRCKSTQICLSWKVEWSELLWWQDPAIALVIIGGKDVILRWYMQYISEQSPLLQRCLKYS